MAPSGAHPRHAIRMAPAASGALVRRPEHRQALEAAVLSAFTTARPCDKKANRPPGRGAGRGRPPARADGREVVVDLVRYAELVGPVSEYSIYQQLRGHLAYLRLGAAAEALPGELEHAKAHKLGHYRLLGAAARGRGGRHRDPPPGQPRALRLAALALAARRLRLRRPARRSTRSW